MIKRIILLVSLFFSFQCLALLPNGFVYLNDIDSSIQVDLRYAGQDNFLGRKVNQYNSKKLAILTEEAALALKKAQEIFNKDGFSIIVYDAYRPQGAVDNFIEWAKKINDIKMKSIYYPRVNKSELFDLGYMFERSSHSRGSTIDLSIIDLRKKYIPIKEINRVLNDGLEVVYLEDGTLDMGSSFDLFDKASHYDNDLVSSESKLHRAYLKKVMESCGFESLPEEWWHFTLMGEPFPDKYYNFPVE
jgi:zinc D-Ala-D-Ala dipeptidase